MRNAPGALVGNINSVVKKKLARKAQPAHMILLFSEYSSVEMKQNWVRLKYT